ncbi:hypothetical protein DXG01_004815 [Tephrocybe rancida]|nr:hypothetical protein DXG01_004815 [Tephrocybe rancida]
MNLASVYNRNDLARPVAAANDLDHLSSAAIASTALMIGEIQSFVDDNSPRSTFDPTSLILFPPSSPPPPTDPIQQYLLRLVRAAQADATDIACSSILAGQGSESDDTGDIAVWLGDGNFATPDGVLEALGLSDWAAGGEIAASNFAASPGSRLDGLLGEMEDLFSFRVSAAMTGGISDTQATLQSQIQVLTDLQNRLQSLRNIPLLLLKPSISTPTLRPEFQQVQEIADTIRTEHIQEALRAGRDSLAGDTSDLNPNLRRENRKRR